MLKSINYYHQYKLLLKLKVFLASLFVFGIKNSFSQVENNNPSLKFLENTNEPKIQLYETPNESKFLQRNFLKNDPIDIKDPKLENNPPNINLENQEKFFDPGDQYLSKLNQKGAEQDKDPNKYKSNQYMGDYRIGGDYARIIFRDHEHPDGDRVRILHNDKIIQSNILLMERFVGLNIKLFQGFNKIDFIALNQGESGPNTAEVRVYDEKGNVTASNQWNLATGVKATYILVKE